MLRDGPLLAESGSPNRWIFSGTKDRYTSEAAIHNLVAENSVRTSASRSCPDLVDTHRIHRCGTDRLSGPLSLSQTQNKQNVIQKEQIL